MSILKENSYQLAEKILKVNALTHKPEVQPIVVNKSLNLIDSLSEVINPNIYYTYRDSVQLEFIQENNTLEFEFYLDKIFMYLELENTAPIEKEIKESEILIYFTDFLSNLKDTNNKKSKLTNIDFEEEIRAYLLDDFKNSFSK